MRPGRSTLVRHDRPAAAGRRGAKRRGSVLVVALLVAAIIAVMLGSFLRLNLASARMSKRSFNGYAALNLAEAGTEEAVWSFNTANHGDTTAWDSWTRAGTTGWKKFDDFNLGSGNSSWVKVYVNNTTPSANGRPKVVALASTGGADDTAVTKMIEVSLRRRAYFANGLVAKKSIAFSGATASVDSWSSDPDRDAATASIPYSTSVRRDGGSVASADVVNTAVLLNQANVWGTVATGGSAPQVGVNGSIRGATTPATVMVDSSRVSTDFNADFDPITAPVEGTTLASVPSVLGVVGTSTKWRTTSMALSGAETLTILGDVTLVLTAGSGVAAISVSGNAAISIPDGSSLTVYAEGDVKIAGKGLGNANNQPISCQIWGTNVAPSGQKLEITGNGALKTVIYAPRGDVTIYGNGDIMGSIVANTITLVGNAAFHYDEALADRESNAPFTISKWRELTTQAERDAYSSQFQF